MVKKLPTKQETCVTFLGQENLGKVMATYTPAFLPGKSYGQRSLVGYSLWGLKELVTTE